MCHTATASYGDPTNLMDRALHPMGDQPVAFGKWLREWGTPASSRSQPVNGPAYGSDLQSDYWRQILGSVDGLSLMIESKAHPDESHRMLVGGTPYGLLHTDRDTSMLVLGPPRSIGKTAGVMIPNVLTHLGPAVVVSTKPDLAIATALHRRRQGRVWQFSPDGSELMPGFEQLRWSPISDDWGGCLARAQWMVKASGMSGDSGQQNGKFWESRAASLLAVTLFYAGLTGRDMGWVVDVINNYDLSGDYREIHDTFLALKQDTAAKLLHGIAGGHDRTTGDIFATAATIISPYLLPGSIETTTDPNFDVTHFVTGDPTASNDLLRDHPMNSDEIRSDGYTRQLVQTPWKQWFKQQGVYDTIYITVSEENMELVAPLIIGFLGDTRRQVLNQHRADELVGWPRRAPLLWCIDELASVPIPELPAILRDAGSQGLLVLGALQTLSQAAKWGAEGRALHTLFNNVLVLPGTRDQDALELWSKLVGQFDQEVWGGAYSGRGREREWNANQSWQRTNKLDPSDIYRGHPNDADAALVFARNSWMWATLQLYYRSGLWPVLLQVSAEFALRSDQIRAQGLPYPDLARGGDTRWLDAIGDNLASDYFRTRNEYLADLNRRAIR